MLTIKLQVYFSLISNDWYNTRWKNIILNVGTRKKQLCVSISGVRLWNSLDDSIKVARLDVYSKKSILSKNYCFIVIVIIVMSQCHMSQVGENHRHRHTDVSKFLKYHISFPNKMLPIGHDVNINFENCINL